MYSNFSRSFSEFLSELIEILMYILLPDAEFQCSVMRSVVREILANCVILPIFTLISDPDFINQAIVSLVSIMECLMKLINTAIE